MSATILLLEDDEGLRRVLSRALATAGYQVRATASGQTALNWIREGQGDLLLADVLLDGHNFLEDLALVYRLKPDMPVIVMSAQTTASMAIDAENSQVFDYLPKPFDLDDMASSIASALRSRVKLQTARAPEEPTGLIGKSAAIQSTFKAIARAARSRAHVLVTGETGTGKRQVAEALLQARGPAASAVRILTASHTAQNIFAESNLAGDVLWLRLDRWGAAQQSAARDALDCSPATIIGTLGASADGVDSGLLARLGECVITVPSLRERREDIPALCSSFLQAITGRDRARALELNEQARSMFEAADWPGNVASLKSALSQLSFMVRGHVATGEDAAAAINSLATGNDPGQTGLAEAMAGQSLSQNRSRQDVVDELDRALLREALRRAKGNRSQAAQLLGLNRNTLARKLTDLGIDI